MKSWPFVGLAMIKTVAIFYGEETLARMLGGNTPPDYKEVFVIGPDDVPSTEYYTVPLAYHDFASNLWPMAPVNLRSNMLTYYASMVDFLGFWREFMRSLSICRKISLPPNLNAILHNYGCFTILCPTNHLARSIAVWCSLRFGDDNNFA